MNNSNYNISVSVSLICFNQVNYIRQCIDSILSQNTDFDFEIIIGDDGSIDGTKAIIQEYCDKNSKIVFLNRRENIGLQKNITDVFDHCSGKYIALIEGDDFWLDNQKLQMQHDFLERNNNCVACFTDSFTFTDGDFENGKLLYGDSKIKFPPNIFNLHFFIKNGVSIPNNTKMFRKSANPTTFPDLFYDCIQWDWFLHINHGLLGDFGFINSPTLAYRRHPNTIINFKNQERIFKEAIHLVYNINSILPKDYHQYFKHPNFELNSLAFFYLFDGRYFKYIFWYFKWLKVTPIKKIKPRDEFYKFRQSLFKRNT